MARPRNEMSSGDDPLNHLDKSVDISIGTQDDVVARCRALNMSVEVEIESVTNMAHAEELAFMEERVAAMITESANPNDLPIEDVYCNGVVQRFIRGQYQPVKRKFVEVLLRAKQDRYETVEYTMPSGEKSTKLVKTTAPRYIVNVNNDSPKGQAWFNRVRSEA
jgi:hypothetical protein